MKTKPFYPIIYTNDFSQGKCVCGSDMLRKFRIGKLKCLRPNCVFNKK